MKIKFAFCAILLAQFITFSAYSANAFKLSSTDVFAGRKIDNKHVFKGFGCSGDNISPPLSWANAPKDTKSFAVTVYDPDAPTGSGWWHWLVVNIPANYSELPRNFGAENSFSLKKNNVEISQIRNDFGIYNFGGPCPPQGDKPHHYIFTVHALKVEKLDIAKDATAALAGFMINANTIAKTSFTALYSR